MKKASGNWISVMRVIPLGLLLLVGCSAKDSDPQTKIVTLLADSFGIRLSHSLTNVHSAYFTYWSMDGGSRVWLLQLGGEADASTNVLQQLDEKHITVVPDFSPIEDKNATSHASWWHPERLGPGSMFILSTDKEGVVLRLDGFVIATTTNSTVFLTLREGARK